MAETLSNIAKSQQTTTVGNTVAGRDTVGGSSSVNAGIVQDNTAKLINDFAGSLGKVMEAKNDASEYAGKRVGTDNLVSYNIEMKKLDAEYAGRTDVKSIDMKIKSERQKEIYEEYLGKGAFGNNETANRSFKDTFAIPATEDLWNRKITNESNYSKMYTQEEVTAVKEEMTLAGGVFDVENVRTWQNRLKAVNQDPAMVWEQTALMYNSAFNNQYKDGVASPAVQKYITDGTITQEGLDNLFNDTYGRFATRTNGEYDKRYTDMDERSYDSMKKSFSSWVSSINKKGVDAAIDNTIVNTVKSLNPSSSDEAIQTNSQQLDIQMVEVQAACSSGNDKACSSLKQMRDAQVSVSVVANKKSELEKKFVQFENSKTNDISILNSDIEISTNVKSYSGFDNVTKFNTIKSSEVLDYIQNRYNKQLTNLLDSPEPKMDEANALAKKLASLQNGSKKGNATSSANNSMQQVSNLAKITKAKTAGELINNLQFAVAYKKETGTQSFKGLNANTLKTVTDFYSELIERKKLDENTYTDAKILNDVRVMASASIYASAKMGYQGTISSLKELGLKYDDESDTLINGEFFGWKVGTGKFGEGSLDVVVNSIKQDGISYASEDEVHTAVRSRMLVVDKSKLPIFGTSLILAKPTVGTIGDSELRDNLIDVAKYKLMNNAKISNVDFTDIVDQKGAIQFRQIDDGINNIQTIAEVIHNGQVVSRAIIDDNEWVEGITQKQKYEADLVFNKINKKESLFDTIDGTKDTYNKQAGINRAKRRK